MSGEAAAGSSPSFEGPSSGGASGEGGGAPDTGAFDYKKALDQQRNQLEHTHKSLESIQRDFSEYRDKTGKDSETIARMREVFEPKKEASAPDPVPEYERMLDYYIAQGLEAEKRGAAMPLTVNLGVQLYKQMIESHKERQENQRVIRELSQKVGELQDPQTDINRQAYSRLDAQIKNNLDNLYGEGDDHLPQKRAMFEAIGGQLSAYLTQLQKEKPRAWDELRRSPQKLSQLANQAAAAHIPPKARQIMMQEQLENTPMSTDELWTAFREANGIKDESQRQEVRRKIREQIVERMYYKERR